jgi:hypothetical protein
MFVFGILAILQVTFIPGMILLKVLKIRWHWLRGFLLAFGLSLVANYALALILVTVGLYLRGVFLAVFIAEIILLAYLYRDTLRQPLGEAAGKLTAQGRAFIRSVASDLAGEDQQGSLSRLVVGLVSLILVVYAMFMVWWGVKVFINGIGMVIDHWDAVASWNKWARVWAANGVPGNTWEYPQLIPLNLSVAYVFMGSDYLEFFNTAVMSMFTGAILLLIFDLALQHRKAGYLAAIIAAQFIIKEFAGVYMNTAYVDIPLAFFAFAAVYAALQAKHQPDVHAARPYVWVSALLAAGAAVTKQPGFWILGFVPLFLFFVVLPSFSITGWKERFRFLFLPFAVAALIVLPWYVYIEIGILSGSSESNLDFISSGIYGDKSRLEIFIDAFRSLGAYGYVLVFVLVGGAWLDKVHRWMVYGIVLPYYLIWASLFSYSPRNLSLAFAFWALAVGLLVEKVLALAETLIEKLKLARLSTALIPILLLVLLVAAGSFVVTDQEMIARHDEAKRYILDRKINGLIYDYFDELGSVEPIVSSYPIEELPGLIGIRISFRDQEYFNQEFAKYPEVKYLLMPQAVDDPLKEQILAKVDSGEYELIFHQNRYYFIHILP